MTLYMTHTLQMKMVPNTYLEDITFFVTNLGYISRHYDMNRVIVTVGAVDAAENLHTQFRNTNESHV